jgi:hypothetical protein
MGIIFLVSVLFVLFDFFRKNCKSARKRMTHLWRV